MIDFASLVASMDGMITSSKMATIVTYTPEVGPAVEIKGIFDANYVLAKGTAEAGVETLGPAVFLRLSDLPVDPEDDEPTLTIRDVEYRVIERRPDSLGGIVLALRRLT